MIKSLFQNVSSFSSFFPSSSESEEWWKFSLVTYSTDKINAN